MTDQVFRARTDDLSWQEVDGVIVLLDERDWQYLQLRGSAAVLWPLLESGATPDRLAKALISHYGISTSTAEADVEVFLGDLAARGIVSG